MSDGLIRRFCLESNNYPGFYPLKPISLIVLPVYTDAINSGNMEYLFFLFSSDFLFTFKNVQFERFQNNVSFEDSANLLPDGTVTGLMSSLVLSFSWVSLRKATLLGDTILTFEKKMDKSSGTFEIEEISAKRFELQSLESIVHGQLPIVQALLTSELSFANSENAKSYLKWTATNLQSAANTLGWLERRMDIMRSVIDAHAQEKTNKRLGRLTILSAIFMPITFLAGLWGMNFEHMPELSYKFGYAIALLSMLSISGAMYFYFRKRGWFD